MLAFHGVEKFYKGIVSRTPVLRGVSFETGGGEILGLIGPNGAGKTTIVNLALGFLWPTAGRIEIDGRPPDEPGVRSRVGWLPDRPILDPRATGAGFALEWLSALGVPVSERRQRVEQLFERFGLAHAADRKILTYSAGMCQKIALILALGHRPDLLILDEPFASLDHTSVRLLRAEIESFSRAGGAALISSHQLSTLSALCTRAIFLDRGLIQKEIRLDEKQSSIRIEVEVLNPETATAALEKGSPAFLREWVARDGSIVGLVSGRDCIPDMVGFLASHDVRIRNVFTRDAELEQVFATASGFGWTL